MKMDALVGVHANKHKNGFNGSMFQDPLYKSITKICVTRGKESQKARNF